MSYWNDPREDNYSYDESFQWNAAMSNLSGMPVRIYKEPSSVIKLSDNPTPPPSPIDEWWGLKLTMPEGGTVILRKNGSPNAVSLEVSTDGQNWQPWTLVGTDYSYTLQAGETLCIRNTSTTFVRLSTGTSDYYNFVFDSTVEASGSVMSLSVNDETVLSLFGGYYNFCNLFQGCTSLVTAPELLATALSQNCYRSMFQDCTSLVKAPQSPATKMESSCYNSMFKGCTSLVIVPDLLATTMASTCCQSMFQDCTSLVNAPKLHAITLRSFCYYMLFKGCGLLSEIRTSMTDISASGCLNSWTDGVAATGDFYCPAELTIPTGVSGIPSGWTRHDI